MAIDFTTESVVPLNKAAQHYPGSRPHLSTVYRHALSGALETFKVGGKRYTSVEAIHRLVERCTNPNSPPAPPASSRRQREIDGANRKLDALDA